MKTLKLLQIGIIMGGLTAHPRTSYAFKPDYDAHGHVPITRDALRDDSVARTFDSVSFTFTDHAIDEIVVANRTVDYSSTFFTQECHFDNESFPGASQRLLDLKASVIAKITNPHPDGAAARTDLGGALHTLQDFYAHSSWVELGHITINTDLGRLQMPGSGNALVAANGGSFACSSVYDPSHLGNQGLPDSSLPILTSGYFEIPLCCPPDGKVRHGLFPCSDGLNKDTPDSPGGIPGHNNHQAAYELAQAASVDFINQILDDPAVAGNEKAILALMGRTETLGFVIDTTGSMGDDIDQVKAEVHSLVDEVRGTDREPGQYLLQTFNDPDVGSPIVTSDADELLTAVDSLYAYGGGDCPELCMTGLRNAIQASSEDAVLHVFTDADAKDADQAPFAIAEAITKKIAISFNLTGSCGEFAARKGVLSGSSPNDKSQVKTKVRYLPTVALSVDPSFSDIALETGGQLFLVNKGELGSILAFLEPQVLGTYVTLLSSAGTVTSNLDLLVPVDPSISNLVLSASTDSGASITFFAPDGTDLSTIDPTGVTVTNVTSGLLARVYAPAVGSYRIHIEGACDYFATARGNSPVTLSSFEFVELKGRPGHEGLFPIDGQPTSQTNATVLITAHGLSEHAILQILSLEGTLLNQVELRNAVPGEPYYVGTFQLPDQPFKVALADANNLGQLLRTFPSAFHAQAIRVSPDSSNPAEFPVGQATTVKFNVTNLGDSGDFSIALSSTLGAVENVTPSTFELASGTSTQVVATVSVPDGTAEGAPISISALASSLSDPDVNNSAVLAGTVTSKAVVTSVPNVTCPADVVTEFTDETGASVQFAATATDLCGTVLTNYSLAPGSTFPIGTTVVTVTASDTCGTNVAQCSFNVTVLGALGVKSNALSTLMALSQSSTNARSADKRKLASTVKKLQREVQSELWADQTHLSRPKGRAMFADDHRVIGSLRELLRSKKAGVDKDSIQSVIERLVKADRLLAVVSVSDDPSRTKAVNALRTKYIARADKLAAAGKSSQAATYYHLAWNERAQPRPTP